MTINGDITIGTALLIATKELSSNQNILSPRLDSEVLLANLLQCPRIDLVLRRDEVLSPAKIQSYCAIINRRMQNEPISYIIRSKEFMSLTFSVKAGILTPRPETEMLVEYIMGHLQGKENVSILDLCTGSGAIAVSLAYYLKSATLTAVDKYDVCVKVARENAALHSVSDRVAVIKADVCDDFSLNQSYDCVVSNPPYITTEEMTTLPPDVKNFEPEYALHGGDDGLTFYRVITEIAKKQLKPNGLLVFEIGHTQGESVKKIIEDSQSFLHVEITKDYAGLSRMVTAVKGDGTHS